MFLVHQLGLFGNFFHHERMYGYYTRLWVTIFQSLLFCCCVFRMNKRSDVEGPSWRKANEADVFRCRPRLASAALLLVSKYMASSFCEAASFCRTTHLHSAQNNGSGMCPIICSQLCPCGSPGAHWTHTDPVCDRFVGSDGSLDLALHPSPWTLLLPGGGG